MATETHGRNISGRPRRSPNTISWAAGTSLSILKRCLVGDPFVVKTAMFIRRRRAHQWGTSLRKQAIAFPKPKELENWSESVAASRRVHRNDLGRAAVWLWAIWTEMAGQTWLSIIWIPSVGLATNVTAAAGHWVDLPVGG